MGFIYHYTKLSTLLALYDRLIEDMEAATTNDKRPNPMLTLRASSIRFLNDTQENQMLHKVLRNLGIPEEHLNTAVEMTGEHFSLSFSQYPDKLALWQRYANNGYGIALGFDEDIIINTNENSSLAIDIEGPCKYTSCDRLEELIKEHLLYQLYKNNPRDLKPLLALYAQSLIYKHEGFEDEGEFRIAFCEYGDEKYRATNTAIIPYQEMTFPVDALKQIVVGPCLDYEKIKYSIMRMQMTLHEKFPSTKLDEIFVMKSEIPFINQ